MTAIPDDDLRAIIESGGKLPFPYFGGAEIGIHSDGVSASGPGTVTPDEALAALKAFLTLTPRQCHADGRHLIAYCMMMVDAVGPEILEPMGGKEPTLDTIWDFVDPKSLSFGFLEPGDFAERRTIFVTLEANVAWEREHGLMMSWADGGRLVKVSAYDGHPTNGHASADRAKDRFIFSCYLPHLCTTP